MAMQFLNFYFTRLNKSLVLKLIQCINNNNHNNNNNNNYLKRIIQMLFT